MVDLPDAPWVAPKKVKTTSIKPEIPDSPWLEEGNAPKSSYGMDILRSVGEQLRQAHEGIVGGGGDIYNLLSAGANKVADWSGMPPMARAGMNAELEGQNWLPTSQDVSQATTPYLGEPYQSQTGPGQFFGTMGGFAANPQKGFFRNVVAPTIGTEVGGEIGEQYGNETLGRLFGGLGGGGATGLTTRGLVGPKVSDERARLTKLLVDQGVDLTGGQVSGRKALRYAETGPFESKPAAIKETQSRQFNRAALKKAGIDADEVTPDVLAKADDAFGMRYDDVVQRAGGIPLDSQLETDLLQNVMDFERLAGKENKAVSDYFKRISDAAQQNNGTVPADIFQQISSEISRDLRKLRGNPQGNAELMDTLREFRSSMFDGVGRSGKPEVVADWQKLNREYRNYKDIERAMYGPGEATKEGMISPAKLGTAVAAGDKAGTLREKGDLSGQAKAGQMLMTDLPQSGTPARLLFPGALAGAGTQIGDDWKSAAATIAGATLPFVGSSVLTAKPVRTSLIRQATNPLPLLDPTTAALSAMMADNPTVAALLARQQELAERKGQ